jgi:uracil-DNA glycosylase family 4
MEPDEPAFPDPDRRQVLEPGCSRCPDLAAAREHISWGIGPDDAAVMVVGEAPGAGNPEADRWRGGNWTGMSYTARHSGRRIRTTLARAGYPEAFFTNAVKCFPPDGEGSNREPTDEELQRCRGHLLAELETVDPDVVVTTGKHATESVLAAERRSIDGFLETVLDPIDCPDLGVVVLPLLHPSYRDVWLSRLGYDYGEYVAEFGALLDDLTG